MAVRRRSLLLAAMAWPAGGGFASAQGDDIKDLLTEHVEIGHDSLGYVAAVIDGGRTRLITVGKPDANGGRTLGGDSVFEVGSITKVFTALLLADMVERGEVAFDDPVAKYLPPQARPKDFDGKAMTLLDLATYTSGLPNLPRNFKYADAGNPYTDYTVEMLYEALAAFTPRSYPGSHYEYANFGFGLLGHVLALRAQRSYEELVVLRICEPLGLDDTRITLNAGMQARLVPGHDDGGRPARNWDLPALAGAGALCSTADDLVRFLDAAQGRRASPLAPAFARLLDVRRQTDLPYETTGCGWFIRNARDDELVWKDGDTGGYSSFIGFSMRSSRAAVVLANAVNGVTVPLLGRHMINSAFPSPALRIQINIDPAVLARLAGQYALTPKFSLTMAVKEGRLMVQATGQESHAVYPESETRFFYRAVDAQLTFVIGPDGKASEVVLHQNGRNLRGRRTG